jgi:sensor histidine kinase regulating citrate/malate metabolism
VKQLLGGDDPGKTKHFVDSYVAAYIYSKEYVSNQTIRFADRTLLMDILPAKSRQRYIGSLVVLRDKTETTKMAAQLTGIDQLIGALRASAHETKNRMHVILGLLQIGETQEAISYIQSSVESDDETANIRNTIRNNTLAALLIGKRNRARELGIEFTVRKDSFLGENSSLLTSADLVTITGNLIENSFDALEGVSNRPKEVTLFIREDENGLFISVDDTGCGMTDEEKEKYLDQDFTTKGEGHGIGGRLIRNILKGFDSELEIESEPGEGTLVNIMITHS